VVLFVKPFFLSFWLPFSLPSYVWIDFIAGCYLPNPKTSSCGTFHTGPNVFKVVTFVFGLLTPSGFFLFALPPPHFGFLRLGGKAAFYLFFSCFPDIPFRSPHFSFRQFNAQAQFSGAVLCFSNRCWYCTVEAFPFPSSIICRVFQMFHV